MFSLGIVVVSYCLIFFPIIQALIFFRKLQYSLYDHYDDLAVLSESGAFPWNRGKDKIYQVLAQHWKRFKLRHINELREVEIQEVEKMLDCKKQYFLYKCPLCGTPKIVYSSCNSRVCTSCGKKYVDNWSKGLTKRLYKKIHRHIVLTIPDKLWPYLQKNQDLLKHLMDCSGEMFGYVLKETKHKDIKPAYLAVLHTFGKDMKYNTHLHLIFAEGGFDNRNKWVDINYIDYGLIRSSWQKSVLTMIKDKLSAFYPEIPSLVDQLYKMYPNGFYIYAKDRIKAKQITARYIGRYIRHPAIASSRIVSFDDRSVTFYYVDYDTKKKVYKTMPIDDFIMALIGHIPNRQFKVIRYYGAYSRKSSGVFRKIMHIVSIVQVKLSKYGVTRQRYAPICDKCKVKMTFVWYSGKDPPPEYKNGERLSDWIAALVIQ